MYSGVQKQKKIKVARLATEKLDAIYDANWCSKQSKPGLVCTSSDWRDIFAVTFAPRQPHTQPSRNGLSKSGRSRNGSPNQKTIQNDTNGGLRLLRL